jgi:hypothetical protein
LAAAAVATTLAVPPGAAGAGLVFHASFGDGARLGRATSIVFSGDLRDNTTPVVDLRLLTPAGVDLASSGLGVASCRRPASEIQAVLSPPTSTALCPANSLMGTGAATASLDMEPKIDGAANLDLYAGASVADKPGLVIVANTYNPVRFHLTYQGYLYVPPPGFGVGVAILLPQVPTLPFGAPLLLSRVRARIGGPAIRYTKRAHGRRVSYHPTGVVLPRRCPRGGFRFRLIARFQDGARQQADAVARCPRS